LRTYVEAAIDFPEEEIDFLADREFTERIQIVRDHFGGVEQSARQGRLLRDGMTVVIAGRPNAGKSSLLNRLAGYEAAIVTPIPGTTRDVLRERIALDGMPLHVLDTAGLREGAGEIEEEGIRRAHAEMTRADRVLFVIDSAADPSGDSYEKERKRLPADVPVTLIFNKCDLAMGIPVADTLSGPPRVTISALNGHGIDALCAHLKSCMGYSTLEAGTVSARQRHLDDLARARRFVEEAARLLTEQRAGELVAEELRQAQQALGEITGEFTTEDLLDRVFSSFCIGK
jgi:tRNA modification GTPase